MRCTSNNWWLGNQRHALCGERCADGWAQDNADADLCGDPLEYVQCDGFITEAEEGDIEPGSKCVVCGKVAEGEGV